MMNSSPEAGVRPARLDHQLVATRLDPTYADPRLERLVAEAAETAREQAKAAGYAQGWAEGRRAAAEAAAIEAERLATEAAARQRALDARVDSAIATLNAAAAATRQASAPAWSEVADALVDGALALAAAALDRELAHADGAAIEAARTALRALGSQDSTVLLNPAEAAQAEALARQGGTELAGVRLVADPSVPAGGAVAVSGSSQVLTHLPTALAAAQEAMLG